MLDPDSARRFAGQLVERAIAAGASAADALYAGNGAASVEVRLGEIESISRSEGESIGLRVFDGLRSASVAASQFTPDAVDLLVERCLAMARQAPEDPFAGLAPAEFLEREPPATDMGDGLEPEPEALRDRALAAEAAAMAVKGVANSGGASASASSGVVALSTSTGFSGAYQSGGHSCSASVIAGEGAAMQRDYASRSARHLADLEDAAAIGERAGRRAAARLGAARVKPGNYPVLFDPRVAPSLLGHFAGAISGGSIARKTSFLQDMLGERIFAPGIMISDDPLRQRGLRSRPFDMEGVRVAPRDLVADGILTQWITDSASARQLGIDPTGHASRGVSGPPGASPSNLYLGAGKRIREELLKCAPVAVLVIELIGHGVNGVTGDYSRGAAGFMVRDGEIAEAVSEFTIASNLTNMFAAMEPGADLEFYRGIDAPTVLVPEMAVA